MFVRTARRPALRWVLALAATAWLLSGVAGDVHRLSLAAPDTAHSVISSTGAGAFAVNGDPAHLGGSVSPACPKLCATAVLPRWAPAWVALGLLVALGVVGGWCEQGKPQTGRSPPHGPIAALTGQDVLTRLCIARR